MNAITDIQISPHFAHTYHIPEADPKVSLKPQLTRILDLLEGGTWMTLAEIADRVGSPIQSVGARLRELRSCGWTVTKGKSSTPGVFIYSIKA